MSFYYLPLLLDTCSKSFFLRLKLPPGHLGDELKAELKMQGCAVSQ